MFPPNGYPPGGYPPGGGGFPPGGGGFPPGGGGFPPGGPGFPPGPPPGGPPGRAGAPTTSPPETVPRYPGPATRAVDPGAIRGCVGRWTYVWLRGGQHFWFWPTYVGARSVSGWSWMYGRPVRRGLDLRLIDQFVCY